MDVVSEQTLSKQTTSSPPQRFFDVPDTKFDAVYGEMASPFLFSPNTRLLDTQYGIRKDCDNLIIVNSNFTVDCFSNIYIGENDLKGRRICGNHWHAKV